jgi:hypothetical protein
MQLREEIQTLRKLVSEATLRYNSAAKSRNIEGGIVLTLMQNQGHPLLPVLDRALIVTHRDVTNWEENGHAPRHPDPLERYVDYIDEYVLGHMPPQYRRDPMWWTLFFTLIHRRSGGIELFFLHDATALQALDELVGPLNLKSLGQHTTSDFGLTPVEVFKLFPRVRDLVAWVKTRVPREQWSSFVREWAHGNGGLNRAWSLYHIQKELETSEDDEFTQEWHQNAIKEYSAFAQFMRASGIDDPDEIEAFAAINDALSSFGGPQLYNLLIAVG